MHADPALASIPTIGYASHVQTDVINAARQAGVGEVLARSAFTQQLGDILDATSRTNPEPRTLTAMNLVDVLRARRRIAPYVRRTPLVRSLWLSDLSGGDVRLKLESLQLANSFKSRGAFNAVLARLERPDDAPSRLVTASAGNHGRALAAAAETFRLPLVVFTPADAPASKLDAIRRHGADAPRGSSRLRRGRAAGEGVRGAGTGAEFISPYNDADVIAGAATIAVEIFEDAAGRRPPDRADRRRRLDQRRRAWRQPRSRRRARWSASRRRRRARFRPASAPGSSSRSFQGRRLPTASAATPIRKRSPLLSSSELVDRIDTVTEDDLTAAIAGLVEHEHLVAEGAGAAAIAALVGGRVEVRGRRVAVNM